MRRRRSAPAACPRRLQPFLIGAWRQLAPPPSANLTRYAWAVGIAGTIEATTDGGAHWVKQTSGTSRIITGIAFADTLHGWAVAYRDTAYRLPPRELVLSTTDGGARWGRETVSTIAGALTRVACVDTQHVWVGGSEPAASGGAVIYASSDGGTTWRRQYLASPGGWGNGIYGLAFADPLHGWAVTGSGHILGTTDGGNHWAVQTTVARLTPSGVACSDAQHCWVVGMGTTHPSLLATTDGGASWHSASTPKAMSDTEAVLTDGPGGLLLGGMGRRGPTLDNICMSANGGLSWRGASVGGLRSGVAALAGSRSGYLWALDYDTVSTSTDGGATWLTRLRGSRVGASFGGLTCPRAQTTTAASP